MHKWLICIDIDEDIEKSNSDMQSKLYFTPVFQILESFDHKKAHCTFKCFWRTIGY